MLCTSVIVQGVSVMLKRPIPLFFSLVFLVIAWLMLTSSLQYQEIVAGIVVSLALAFGLNSILPDGGKGSVISRSFRFVIFVLVLAKEMVLANFDVAYRVLHPKMPIRPGIIEVRPGLETEMGKLLLSNSITLTPGTLSMDWIDDRLYIHWINVDEKDHDASMRPLDKTVKGVFP
ncbi:MAG: Na+/H+ antiporter subunit E [Thermoplasmata archaeon]|nr:MAG: Na+/H+ antiporter subunit E [Thermoplasmata archaeon]